MRKSVDRRARAIAPLFIALLLASCGPSEQVRQQLAQLEGTVAQRDSLINEMADLARFVSDVGAEVQDVQLEGADLVAAESPVRATRDSVLARVKTVRQRLAQTEQRLAQSRRRVQSLTRQSDSLRTVVEETIASYQRQVESQQATITELSGRVESLEAENVRLVAAVDTLKAEVDTLRTEAAIVYYVAGTKDELLERGIIREEGGSRFPLLVTRVGETVVPARNLEPAAFTAIDMRSVTEIPLPDTTASYRIASRHPLEFVELPTEAGGKVRGTLRITSPDDFWKTSKFLILVRG
jgi:cell division protein FtsB